MKPKFLNDSDPWMLAEDIPDMDFFFSQIWLTCFIDELKWPVGRAYNKILSIYRGYHLWFYYGQHDSERMSEHVVKRFVKNPHFAQRVNKEVVHWAGILRRFAEKVPVTGLEKFTNLNLWRLYQHHDQIHTDYYRWGWIPVGSDMFHGTFTERLILYLRKLGIRETKLNEVFMILTQPTKKSMIQIEHEEFLKLAQKIKRDQYHRKLFQKKRKLKAGESAEFINKIRPFIWTKIKKHYDKYFYLPHMWVGKAADLGYYLNELAKLIRSRRNIKTTLLVEQKDFSRAVKKRQETLKKWGIARKWRILFEAFGDFMVTKICRRYAQIYAIYKMEFVLREIGRRFGLSLKEIRFVLPQEIEKMLLNNKFDKKAIKKRTKFCVYYAEKGFERIYTGKKAKDLAKKVLKGKIKGVSELKGQCGCVGRAKGMVKLIFRAKDMAKMKRGDILVSIATDPDIVPAMKKAAAIVTEQGGVTSHAAIVSRELGIPCVIGTKIATKVLKDGDRVEVDATKGTVKKL